MRGEGPQLSSSGGLPAQAAASPAGDTVQCQLWPVASGPGCGLCDVLSLPSSSIVLCPQIQSRYLIQVTVPKMMNVSLFMIDVQFL